MKDATYWAQQIKDKKISPLELLEKTKQKIEKLNPNINAVVEYDIDLAKHYLNSRPTSKGLFDGVPFPLKMLGQDFKGMGSTSCSKVFAEHVATSADNYTKQVMKAGFIPFGKTNSPEFGFKNITDSELYGDTKNPWNSAFYSGGSSGGAASAVASGMFPIAGASDGGGSIRIPAAWSGLIGLKPTRGRTPVGPKGWRGWQGAAVDFALTVSVRDTARFLAEMQVVQEANPFSTPLLDRDQLLNLETLKTPKRIAFSLESPINSVVNEEAKQAVRKAVAFLEEQGHEVEEITYPIHANNLIETYYQMNAAETFAMVEQIEEHQNVNPKKFELMTQALIAYGKKITAADYIRSLNDWDQATVAFTKVFNSYDYFITPTTAKLPIRIGEEMWSEETRGQLELMEQYDREKQKQVIWDMFNHSLSYSPYPFIINLTGQTAISLPVYLSREKLPTGVMVTAPKGGEIELLRLSKLFEDHNQFGALATQLWED